jgi:hypothetical protein
MIYSNNGHINNAFLIRFFGVILFINLPIIRLV